MQKYRHENTSVSLINYHFVWCPRRRRKIITGDLKNRLVFLIRETVEKLNCTIIAIEAMPDHVHLFVNAPPDISPSQIVGRIKVYSSRILRDEFEVLQKMPSTWTRSYFVSTAGNVSTAKVKKYIEEQKTRA